jgi:hypothetical protein
MQLNNLQIAMPKLSPVDRTLYKALLSAALHLDQKPAVRVSVCGHLYVKFTHLLQLLMAVTRCDLPGDVRHPAHALLAPFCGLDVNYAPSAVTPSVAAYVRQCFRSAKVRVLFCRAPLTSIIAGAGR